MRQSHLFFKTQKDFPKDETSANAQFLIRANFVQKLMAGAYSFLPLGWRVIEKIQNVIREEMNALGASEILMPALHPQSAWDVTGRWEGMSKVMYQFKDRAGHEFGLGPTHEEIVTPLAKPIISSYADLPLSVYQIQMKFRDEPRAKSGLIRGRQFIMKDLYSFHENEASLEEYYDEARKAYLKVFSRLGLKTYVTEASGGDFTKNISHEFMVESEAGEDEILLCRLCGFARNKEIAELKAEESCPKCGAGVLEKVKGIEVGNIFKLGTKFSEPVGLTFKNKKGEVLPVVMGCYGIGVDRLMGAIVEVHHDEKGILWPEEAAPFPAHLLQIGESTTELQKFGALVYNQLVKEGVEPLFDDRAGLSAGEKFFDADLIGLPWRVVVSEKTMVQDKIEVKKRNSKETKLVKVQDFIREIKS